MTQPMSRHHGDDRKRGTTRLNAALDKRLFSYAAVAGAAGVSLLAQTAQAKIVYTPADLAIQANRTVPLDLNNDGVKDFFFFLSLVTSGVPTTLSVDPVHPNNRILGSKLYASALPAGVSVGPGGKFQQEHDFMVSNGIKYPRGSFSRGPWKGTQDSYLGLKLYIQGEAHYGWARLTVNATQFPMTATLTGYAYETQPNTAILTGATSGANETGDNHKLDPPRGIPTTAQASLGLLAQGSSGLTAWRRNE